MLTHDYLITKLNYNPETGIFTWLNPNNKRIKIGDITGSFNIYGYITITILGKKYKAHRLAWLYVYGTWPKNQIDHINGIKTDNRIENLRDVTSRQNSQNRKEHRNGHLVGTDYYKPTNKFRAVITVNRKQIYLGYYNTQQEAHQAYLTKLEQLK